VAFVSLLSNAALGAILMFPLKHGGLALATSLAAGVNCILLAYLLRKKIGPMGIRRILHSFAKNMLASILMGATAYAIVFPGPWETSGITAEKMTLLGAAVGGGAFVYGAVSYFLGGEEIKAAMKLAKKKAGRFL
jgi:putative peptidoglycan lipid II flippase